MIIDHEKGIAHYLARLVCRIRSNPFSEDDYAIVRQHMMDAIASAFLGCRSEVFADLATLCPKVKNGYAWPGSGMDRVSPLDAGMLWAFAIHASVFEDGSREGACHPAAAVIPTIIALSESKGWDLIDRSVFAGYDVMVRLARSGNPEFTWKGFHPTSITAPFAAAAAASILLGHDMPRTQNALCLAAFGSAGLMAAFRSGSTQPLQVALAVRSGIVAAMMAGAGHSGYSRIIEEGFYGAYLGQDPDPAVDYPLEYDYAIKGSYLKPYPGCRHVHPSIDAFGKVLTENEIDYRQIHTIHVRTYKIAVETEIHDLKNRGDAYFNIAYALAARAVLGENGWDAFDEKHFTNKGIIELMNKITVSIDPEVDRLYPGQRGSVVEVHMVDGDTLSGKITYSLGEPENPLPESVTLKKFRDATGPFLSKKSMDRFESLLDVTGPSEHAQSLFETVSETRQAW
jgi:2-methylcitrate dehydratase PrpD